MEVQFEVGIDIKNGEVGITDSHGTVATIDRDLFAESPRKAIAMADLMAAAPKMLEFIKERRWMGPSFDGADHFVDSLGINLKDLFCDE